MQMIEQRLFPTLVGKFEEVLFPEQCDELLSSIDASSLKKYEALTGEAVTSFNKQFNIFTDFPPTLSLLLQSRLDICINQYVNTYGCLKVNIVNSWISYQYPHSKLVKHTHPGSHISGVLYLRADEKSSPIYFYNPNPFATFTSRANHGNDFTREHVKFTPKTGDLLIFPSWLSHGSDIEENMSEERIILSFNTENG